MLVPALLTLVVSCACLERVTGAVNPEVSQVYETASAMSSLEKKMEFLIQQVQDMKTQLESRIEENQASTLQQVQDMKTQLESNIEENQQGSRDIHEAMESKMNLLEFQLNTEMKQQQNMVVKLTSIQMEMNTSVAAAVDEKFTEFSNRTDVLDTARLFNLAFSARAIYDQYHVPGQTILFPAVTLNTGDAYNNETGIFTCPLQGIYFFQGALFTYNAGDKPTAYINRDGDELVGLRTDVDDSTVQMTNSVMTSCAPLQHVYIRANNAVATRYGGLSSTFSGFYLGSE